jgi:hypothetical protein
MWAPGSMFCTRVAAIGLGFIGERVAERGHPHDVRHNGMHAASVDL